jgi:2'-5' RNA ligase
VSDRGGRTAIWLALDDLAPSLAAAYAELDPETAARLPLHITVLFPFVGRDEVTSALVRDLDRMFARQRPLSFSLGRIEVFSGVAAYAAPEPSEQLCTLIRNVAARFPDTPPYGGAFGDDIVPHATLCKLTGDREADAVAFERVLARAEPLLPIRCEPGEVSLVEEFQSDRWRERDRFRLASGSPR